MTTRPPSLMATYPEPPVTFVRGEGAWLFDDAGRPYLDLLCGLAVTSLGHAHPAVAEAVAVQARTLAHVSNLFGTVVGPEVAAHLDRLLGGGGRVFFANSGAEANEAAIKLARKFGGRGRHVLVSAHRSFHGRTLATLHATGQPEKHEAFQPLPEGFRHVAFDDLDALDAAVDASVAAVLLEVVQGEGGVRPVSPGYLAAAAELCHQRGALLMVDEVQTGLARTGAWFAFQHHGVQPDVVTVAKALGNGMPIGACWARAEIADVFEPGDHATTYGGQPLAASAAGAVLAAMEAMDAPAVAQERGARLTDALLAVPGVKEVRGLGLLLAAELGDDADARQVAQRLLVEGDVGVVVNAVTATAVRLAPPLVLEDDHIELAATRLAEVLADR